MSVPASQQWWVTESFFRQNKGSAAVIIGTGLKDLPGRGKTQVRVKVCHALQKG